MMSQLQINLFQKFAVQCNDRVLDCIKSQKAQELFCYLLINRNRPHSRETLADTLWAGMKTNGTKKYLRKALWQLQTSLNAISGCVFDDLLRVEPEWLEVEANELCQLDVASFEEAYVMVRGVRGSDLGREQCSALKHAVQLYKGDLLEGWYQDWCILERERFKEMLIVLNSKLISYHEAQADYGAALAYGHQLLQFDNAHERTHRRLMRIHYLAGDRTAALRQYERCKRALRQELLVEPSARTTQLFQEIVKGEDNPPQESLPLTDSIQDGSRSAILFALSRIKGQLAAQTNAQTRILRDIQQLEETVRNQI